jgi:hypothetical protein
MFPEEPARLLSAGVMEDDHAALSRILGGVNWQVAPAFTPKDARAELLAHKTPIVICSAPLRDSHWKSWVAETCRLPDGPKLIVSSRPAYEGMWAEALDLGCYDVLSWPYADSEVLRVVSLAWRSWKLDYGRPVTRPKPPRSASRVSGSSDANRAGGVR